MAGILYLVATPIGNLGDFSPRAAETLAQADFIAAEDTRVSVKLLNHFDIKKPLVSYHEHNRAAAGQAILERLLSGETCALVTDAGTPAISDPGQELVALCAENGVTVQAIPGCCAAIAALAVSGLDTRRFTFEGFLPSGKKERRAALEELTGEARTMVFHEAPHRLRQTLADMVELLGDRPADGQDCTVVVLGCQVFPDGHPSLMLRGRINAAYDYLTAHPDALCVASGGQNGSEPISEA